MSATGAFRISLVGSGHDLARLQASAVLASDRLLLEQTNPDQIEAMASDPPDVAVIGSEVQRPLPIARQIRVASPQSQIVFLLPGERLERFRAALPFVPNLGSAWTASTGADAASLLEVLSEAARAARQRAATAIMLGRINQKLSARADPAVEARRSQLVLTERYLATILTQSPDGFVAVDGNGGVIAYNDAAVALFGHALEGGNILDSDSIPDEQKARLKDLVERGSRGETHSVEIPLKASGEMVRYLDLSLAPVHDERGVIASVSMSARDITERKRLERHQHLLIAELNHRVKNTLAVVQSLAHQTFRADKPPEEAIRTYEGRLSALSDAHNLLTRENWEAASLQDVVSGALQPFCPPGRCAWSGPNMRVPPRIAVSLTLALHELATNAQKYGAMSTSSGRIDLTWDLPNDALHLLWVESGGPPVQEPASAGFGTRMLRRALATDLKGRVEIDFQPSGLVCRISAGLNTN